MRNRDKERVWVWGGLTCPPLEQLMSSEFIRPSIWWAGRWIEVREKETGDGEDSPVLLPADQSQQDLSRQPFYWMNDESRWARDIQRGEELTWPAIDCPTPTKSIEPEISLAGRRIEVCDRETHWKMCRTCLPFYLQTNPKKIDVSSYLIGLLMDWCEKDRNRRYPLKTWFII